MDEPLEFTNQVSPPGTILLAIGSINLLWARLDALATASLHSLIGISTTDFLITAGRIETLAKLLKVKKILHLRKDSRAKEIDTLIKKLDPLKEDRNAITHGFYLGIMQDNRAIFVVYPDVVEIDSDTVGTRIHAATLESLTQHTLTIADAAEKLVFLFGKKALRELFQTPGIEQIRGMKTTPPQQDQK